MERPQGETPLLSRRAFMKGLTAAGAAAFIYGCSGSNESNESLETPVETLDTTQETTSSGTAQSPANQGQEKIRGLYVPNWVDYDNFANDLPDGSFNRLLIAFAEPREDGRLDFDQSQASYAALITRLATQRAVISLSVGGWGGDDAEHDSILRSFKKFAREPNRFADTVAQTMQTISKTTGLAVTSVDVDFEYPDSADQINPLLTSLRQTLPPGTHISAAVPSWVSEAYEDNAQLGELIDTIKLMSYDYDLGQQIITTSVAPLNLVMESVRAWREHINASNIVVGLPNYAHLFRGAKGLGSPVGQVEERQYPELDDAKLDQIPLSEANPGYETADGWVSVAPVQHLRQIIQTITSEHPDIGGFFYWSALGATAEHAALLPR